MPHSHHARKVREHHWEKQGGKCIWCDADVPLDHATLEHITPKHWGGKIQGNSAMACASCNQARGYWTERKFAGAEI